MGIRKCPMLTVFVALAMICFGASGALAAKQEGKIVHDTKYYILLFRDTREEYPVSTEVGAWGGQEFVRIIQRHMMRKKAYPDEGPARGRPYDGIENLRPESKAAVEAFLLKQRSPTLK